MTLPKILLLSVSLLGVALTGVAGKNSFTDIQSGDVQLVQSIPLETDLSHATLPHAKDVWLEMIRGAQESIDLGQFYVSARPGQALDLILEELEKAAERGVRIRLLISNALMTEDPATIERFKTFKNSSVRIMNLSKATGGILHAKYWIIDGKDIFVGSQNFDWRALSHIHETGVRLRDARLAEQLRAVFELDWKFAETGEYPSANAQTPFPTRTIELVASPPQLNPPGIRSALEALLELLSAAKKSIRIQLLDYAPVSGKPLFWPEIDNALRAAAVRGVKVQLLVSHWNTEEAEIPHLKSLSLVPGIEIRIATIPEHSSGHIPYARVVHSKYMVVDDKVLWLGTSNWSRGYFYASRNVELIFRVPDLARQGFEIFERLWNSPYCEKIDINKVYPKPVKN